MITLNLKLSHGPERFLQNFGSVNFKHSLIQHQQDFTKAVQDHTVLAKQHQIDVQKSLVKLESFVTALYLQLGGPLCLSLYSLPDSKLHTFIHDKLKLS